MDLEFHVVLCKLLVSFLLESQHLCLGLVPGIIGMCGHLYHFSHSTLALYQLLGREGGDGYLLELFPAHKKQPKETENVY